MDCDSEAFVESGAEGQKENDCGRRLMWRSAARVRPPPGARCSDLGRLLDRKVAGFAAFEDLVHVPRAPPEPLEHVRAVLQESASVR